MTPETVDTISITAEELLDLKIDERLAQQRNVGPGTIRPIEEEGRFFARIFYSTWFYLSLAGVVGALIGWALVEPYFSDGVVFTGRVQQVATETAVPNIRQIMISGVPVFVSTDKTTIRGGEKNQISYTTDDLRVDSVVKLMGEPFELEGRQMLAAEAMVIEPPGTEAPPSVDIAVLQSTSTSSAWALSPLVGAFVGLLIGCVEGLICRTIKRAIRCGLFGILAGGVGGFVSALLAGLIYNLMSGLVGDSSASGGAFMVQMFSRGLAWMLVGTGMGLGQGLALRSGRLLLNGLIGGLLGGLVGGLLFDPISLLLSDPAHLSGAELSRGIGIAIIGTAVGLMIGVTDMLTRSAWLRVMAGPLRGKEFSFYQTPIRLGSSPKNEIYLFKDPKIDPIHAHINKLRDTFEIEDNESATGTLVNGQRVKRKRLFDGDKIQIGESEFVYTTRDKK